MTTRRTRRGCSGAAADTPYPKDGINDHVVHGAATVNPAQRGHEGGVVVPGDGPGGGPRRLRLRLRLAPDAARR